ncbi:MAG: hypothetical protein E7552_06835 [Ruminococcaceae bacterium]|nr:hypothetical protein [Oscillospiraceae bacterium]
MKNKSFRKTVSMLLALVMLVGVMPTGVLPVLAGHPCPDCQDWIDGSPYCDECYACDQCIELCLECGKCTGCTGADICEGCSDEESGPMCTECTVSKGSHCPGCDACYFATGVWCEECGLCEECSEYDEGCSNNLGEGILCVECASSRDSHCPNCNACYFEVGSWCEECMQCFDCVTLDEQCSIQFGAILCEECVIDRGTHCPECEECYFEVGSWCEECGRCENCSAACVYCCEEMGEIICAECAIDQGLHCPECSECYGECGGEYCIECGVCANCADICATEEMCTECAINEGYHCPGCETCGDDTTICEGCGERCYDCADAFCESCNLCAECVLICQGCGACEECATICPNCEEYCSECEGICDDCELCLVCCADIAAFAGCDCGDWVCVESDEWDAHFAAEHTAASGGHNSRPAPTWERDDTYHWHPCVYCDATGHRTGKSAHTYDATGKCSACYYVKDAKVIVVAQPKDVTSVIVTGPYVDYGEHNLAHFSVTAMGNSNLTYTWCRRQYVGGVLTYVPLTNPLPEETYKGPDLYIYAPTDACANDYYVCCIITDEEGNEVKTRDALLRARHDYRYWRTETHSYEKAERNLYGHVLQCVADECGKATQLRPHEDEDRDGLCDICDYEVGGILITKQPRDTRNVFVTSADEDYDESNLAHFSVEAIGEGALTYTWCRKQYVGGVLTYVPLRNPSEGECYDGPDLYLLAPTDACCQEYTYACIITDEAGNETRTVDVVLRAKHNYQYYKQYQTHKNPYPVAKRRYIAHKLYCVGEGCGKVTRYRSHVDENRDYICDICDLKKDMYEEVGVFVTAPKEGALPSYSVTADRPLCYRAVGDSTNYTQHRFWFVSDNGTDNWKLMDKNTPFVAGKYYKIAVEMETAAGYEFWPMVSYDGEEPYIWAKVNGNSTKAHKVYGKDPLRYITIYYEFGMCNDSVIENIVIDNVIEPVAGQKPTYSATVRGSGYYVDVSKNVYYDDWMNGQKLYYIKNGVGWFDVTAFEWVYANEAFIPGHRYAVRVYLKTEEGYTFYHDRWNEMLFTASVNGTGAEGNTNTTNNLGLTEQTISAEFLCQPQEVSTVMVYDLDAPRAGETPDYTMTTAYPEVYQLDPNYAGTNGVIWYDSEGNMLEPTDTFAEGEQYKVEIKVIPTQLNGANVCKFASNTVAYLDGEQVVERPDWDMVYASSGAVYIYYTFAAGALPPERKGSISGYVTVTDDTAGDVTLQLIPEGRTEPLYETVLKSNTISYRFARIAAGTYTLKAQKAGCNTAVYTVIVADSAVIQNVTLDPANPVRCGDADGNGTVTSTDARLTLQYAVQKIDSLPNKAAADVDGNGTVNSTDARLILQYAVMKIDKFPAEG